MKTSEQALKAGQEDLDAEKAAFAKEKSQGRTEARTEDEALRDQQEAGDRLNQALFDKRTAERAGRCKVPLEDSERVELKELESKASAEGPSPGPQDMMRLGELRERAKLET